MVDRSRNGDNYLNELDIPLGISMAVSQNPALFGMFASLTPLERESLIHSTAQNDAECERAIYRPSRKRDRDFDLYG